MNHTGQWTRKLIRDTERYYGKWVREHITPATPFKQQSSPDEWRPITGAGRARKKAAPR